MVVGYKVDTDNHRILQEMLADANGVTEGTTQRLPDKVVNRESVADTGATVVCGGDEIGIIRKEIPRVPQSSSFGCVAGYRAPDSESSSAATQIASLCFSLIPPMNSEVSCMTLPITATPVGAWRI